MIKTRFAPTVSSGDIHIGHSINFYCNFFEASRGYCGVLFEDHGQSKDNNFIRRNTNVMKEIYPNCRIWQKDKTNDELIYSIFKNMCVEKNIDYNSFPIYSNHFFTNIIDFMNGTNLFIRGRDWLAERDSDLSFYYINKINKSFGKDQASRKFHPLYISEDGKISKSAKIAEFSIENLINSGVKRITLFAFFLLKFFPKKISIENEDFAFEFLNNKERWINEVYFSEDVLFNLNELNEVNERILKINKNTDVEVLYNKFLSR